MSGDVTVTSTTDSQEAVDAAANLGIVTARPTQPVEEKVETPSVAEEAETAARREPAPEEESEEEEPSEPAEEEEEPEQEAMGKTRRKLLRTVSRLNRERYDLKERLEVAEGKLRQIERGGKEEPAPAAAPPGRPDKDKYADVDQYVQDMVKWTLDERARLDAQQKIEQYKQETFSAYNREVESARDNHEDFDEVLGQEITIPELARDVMFEMDNGPEVAYYLGKHPEVVEKLLEYNAPFRRGGQARIVAELYKLSEKLEGNSSEPVAAESDGSSKTTRPVRRAPAPIEPVRGGSAKVAVNPDTLPYRDFKKWREEHGATRR